jgi:hypothetical protein
MFSSSVRLPIRPKLCCIAAGSQPGRGRRAHAHATAVAFKPRRPSPDTSRVVVSLDASREAPCDDANKSHRRTDEEHRPPHRTRVHERQERFMCHVFFRPRPPLDALVEHVWATDGYAARTPRERVLPSTEPGIAIHLETRPLRIYASEDATAPATVSDAVLCGGRTAPTILDTSVLGATVGVMFKAGGARQLLDVPPDVLGEGITPLEAI